MTHFGCRYNLCQALVIFVLCSSLAGETQPTQISREHHPSSNVPKTTNSSKNSSTTPWYFLSVEDREKIAIVTMSVSAMSGLLNFLVIVAIVIDPLKILRKGPWVTIFNLATADLISSVSFFFFWSQSFFIRNKELFNKIVSFCWIFGASGSFLWLTMFAVQIFVLTKSPLRGRYWFTTGKMVLIGIGIWICAFLLGLTELTWLHFPEPVALKFYIGQIGVLQIAVLVQIILNIQVTVAIIRAEGSFGNVENSKHKNIAKTVIILTLILFLTAFLHFLFKQMEFLSRLGYFGQSKTAGILEGLSYCYTPIAMLNFLANPILYSLRLPDYRQTLLVFVGKGKKKKSSLKKSSTRISSIKLTRASTARSQKASTTSM